MLHHMFPGGKRATSHARLSLFELLLSPLSLSTRVNFLGSHQDRGPPFFYFLTSQTIRWCKRTGLKMSTYGILIMNLNTEFVVMTLPLKPLTLILSSLLNFLLARRISNPFPKKPRRPLNQYSLRGEKEFVEWCGVRVNACTWSDSAEVYCVHTGHNINNSDSS